MAPHPRRPKGAVLGRLLPLDFYYRLAVVELHLPQLRDRSAVEQVSLLELFAREQ